MDNRLFFLNALEEVDRTFNQPLSSYHSLLQQDAATIRNMPQFLVYWTRFKDLPIFHQDNSSIVHPYLKVLSDIVEHVLISIGDEVATRYLKFSLDQFRKVQMFLVSVQPFHAIALAQESSMSNSNLRMVLQRCFTSQSFKPLQREAICATMSHSHVICLFPTGSC